MSISEYPDRRREGGGISRENLEGAQLMRDSPERFSGPTDCVRGYLGYSRVRPPCITIILWAKPQITTFIIKKLIRVSLS